MDPRRRKYVRIDVCQNRRHRAAGRQSGHKDGLAAKAEFLHELARKRSQNSGLAGAAFIMGVIKNGMSILGIGIDCQ